MGDLFSCDHCQSVLKWEGGALKVVFESKGSTEDLVQADGGGEEAIKEEEITGKEGELVDQDEKSEAKPFSSGELGISEEEILLEERVEQGAKSFEGSSEQAGAEEDVAKGEGEVSLDELAGESAPPLGDVAKGEGGEGFSEEGEGVLQEEGVLQGEGESALDELAGEGETPLGDVAKGEGGEGFSEEGEGVLQEEGVPQGEGVLQEEGDVQATAEEVLEEQKGADKEQDFSDVENYGNSTGADLKGF